MSDNVNNAWWLAIRQMRDNRVAYLSSAIYFLFMGLVLAADEYWTVEIALSILMFILIQPALSSRYMTLKQDNEVSRHQVFLHSLPVGFDTIILARILAMLVAGLINVPLFLLPFWFIGPSWSSVGVYLAWCTFWIGMGLIGAGLALVQEFKLSMREWIKVNFVLVIVVVAMLIGLMVWSGIRPYRRSVELAHEFPLLLATVGLVLGLLVLWRCSDVAIRGFRRREFAL